MHLLTKPESQLEAHPPATPPQFSAAGPFHPRIRSCHTAVSELKCFLLPYLSRGGFLSPLQTSPSPPCFCTPSPAPPDSFRAAHLTCEVCHNPPMPFFFKRVPISFILVSDNFCLLVWLLQPPPICLPKRMIAPVHPADVQTAGCRKRLPKFLLWMNQRPQKKMCLGKT